MTNFYLGQKHVSKINQGSGLVLLWKSDFDISVFTSSLNHIDTVIITGKENSGDLQVSIAFLKHTSTLSLGMFLKTLNLNSSFPLLCAKDFNEIVKSHGKLCGRARPGNQMKDFHEVLDGCSFADLSYVGQKYTWCKRMARGIIVGIVG